MRIEVPTLTDGVVTLRAHTDDDIERCLEQSLDAESVRWTPVSVPYIRDDAARLVRHAMPGGWATDEVWGFAVEYDGKYAGTVSLRNEREGRAELAYGSHPDVRGTGAMERACRLLLAWGFAERGLRTVSWWCHDGNWASRKLAWRLGFDIAPTVVRRWLPHRGELVDSWVGTLLADDARGPRHPWLDAPVVDLDSFRMRPLSSADDTRIVEACNDHEASHWLGEKPAPFTARHARDWRERCTLRAAMGAALTWALADSDDALIGALNIFAIRDGTAEIGYWIHPDARGRSVATTAARAALRHAFVPVEDGGLGLRRVHATAAVGNAASQKVLEGAGMQRVGVDRSVALTREGWVDGIRYDAISADLRPR